MKLSLKISWSLVQRYLVEISSCLDTLMLFWCSTLCRGTMRCSNLVGRTRYLIENISCLGYEVEILLCLKISWSLVQRYLVEIISCLWYEVESKDILVSCPEISRWNFILPRYAHLLEQQESIAIEHTPLRSVNVTGELTNKMAFSLHPTYSLHIRGRIESF